MTTIFIFIITLATLFVAILILLFMAVNQHKDETDYLDSFLDQCTSTDKNRALAERELDMLRYKISDKRIKEFEDKLKYRFE